MKKIMILGASILQLPAIIKAKEMGHKVIAVDMDKNAIGFEYADICEIISTTDIKNVLTAAKKYKIEGIMTLASDMPMRTVAIVAKELGIPGITEETAIKATNKVEMRKSLKQFDVPIPTFYSINHWEDYCLAVKTFTSKFIVKPADNSGSRGVYLVDDAGDYSQIKEAFCHSKNNSRNGDIIVEEYMEGPEVSVETISFNGKCNVVQITDKLTTGSPYFVEMGHSQPCKFNDEIKEKIINITEQATKAIGILEGPAHVEIKLTKNGPKIVELGARLGGDNITTHLVPLSTGINMVENCIKIALGEKPDLGIRFNAGSAIRYFKTDKGIINKIDNLERAKKIHGIKQISFVKSLNSKIDDIKSSNDRIGFVIAQDIDAEKAIYDCERAMATIKISISKEDLNENSCF